MLALPLLFLFSLADCGARSELRLGTGNVGGTYDPFGSAHSQQLGWAIEDNWKDGKHHLNWKNSAPGVPKTEAGNREN